MRKLFRHKQFIKDMRSVRLTDGQAEKLFVYVAALLKTEVLPAESKDHSLQGKWNDFRECHLGGDTLLIYKLDEKSVCLTRLGSHAQLFKM